MTYTRFMHEVNLKILSTLCAHVQQGQAFGRVRMYVYLYNIICIYVIKSITAVSHLSAQKPSPNLVCWCVFGFICHSPYPLLLVSRRSNTIPRYYIFKHPYGQPPQVHRFYLCALMQSAHSSSL